MFSLSSWNPSVGWWGWKEYFQVLWGGRGQKKIVGEVTYGTAVEQFFLCVRSDACLTTLSNIGDNQHRN